MGKSDGKIMQENHVCKSCEENLVGKSDGKILREFLT